MWTCAKRELFVVLAFMLGLTLPARASDWTITTEWGVGTVTKTFDYPADYGPTYSGTEYKGLLPTSLTVEFRRGKWSVVSTADYSATRATHDFAEYDGFLNINSPTNAWHGSTQSVQVLVQHRVGRVLHFSAGGLVNRVDERGSGMEFRYDYSGLAVGLGLAEKFGRLGVGLDFLAYPSLDRTETYRFAEYVTSERTHSASGASAQLGLSYQLLPRLALTCSWRWRQLSDNGTRIFQRSWEDPLVHQSWMSRRIMVGLQFRP